MSNTGQTELLEWEMDQVDNTEDNAFEAEDEGQQWVSHGKRQHQESDGPRPALTSVPHNWRQNRDMLSPLEGAQKEVEEAAADTTETSGNEIQSQDSTQRQHQSGGDKFQALDDGFGDGDTYFYDEDLTRSNQNSSSESRQRTQSDADLIFRETADAAPASRWVMVLRYLIVATLALTVGIVVGFAAAKATDPTIDKNMTSTVNGSV